MTRRAVAGVVVVVALGGTLWWARGLQPAASTPVLHERPPSVLLVTIDTLRADHVGIYGSTTARTPWLDGLARSGVRFSRAYAAAPVTLPSHASLLTGLNPPAHGARHNGMHVNGDVPTLATRLSAAGFATGAFVSAFPLDRRFGLARGFGTYDGELPRGPDGRQGNERPGAVTVDRAVAWLGARGGEPFFLWVHLFEPHAPYGAADAASRARPVLDRYDDEVAEADAQVGRLLAAIAGERERTLVVVAADHGEAFGEHGEVTHSLFVYDTTLRVPFVMSGPGIPEGREIGAPVGLVDVAPTVLTMLRLNVDRTDGRDLSAAIAGTAPGDAGRALYAESFAPLLDFGWSPLRTVREGRWKYIDAPRPELYDLDADPAEQADLATEHLEDARRMAEVVARYGPRELPAPSANTDRDAASRLATLGYVTPSASSSAGSRPDPKDRRAVAARLAEIASGEMPDSALVPSLLEVLQDDPGNAQAHLRLGVAYADVGKCGDAEPHLRRAIAAGVPTADPYLSLALCLRVRGDRRGAERALADASRVEPGNPVVEANLGLLAFDEGRLDAAVPRLQAALAIDPDLHQARFTLARALARRGNRDAARREAETLLARMPPGASQRAEVERLLAALR